MRSELVSRNVERDPSSERRLFEQHRDRAVGEGSAVARRVSLDVRGERDHCGEPGAGEITDR